MLLLPSLIHLRLRSLPKSQKQLRSARLRSDGKPMFEYKRKRRKLQLELITELERKYRAIPKGQLGMDTPISSQYDLELDRIRDGLKALDTKYLLEEANRFDVDVSMDDSWWETDSNSRKYLSELGKAKLEAVIREKRYSYWKRWTDLIIPIISTLIALLALAVALIALYKK
jgi:hypothetical protein